MIFAICKYDFLKITKKWSITNFKTAGHYKLQFATMSQIIIKSLIKIRTQFFIATKPKLLVKR